MLILFNNIFNIFLICIYHIDICLLKIKDKDRRVKKNEKEKKRKKEK